MSETESYEAVAEAEMRTAREEPRGGWLHRWRWPMMIGGPLVILGVAAFFILTSGRYQTTDDAYVDVAKAPVAASVPGRVVAVFVHENEAVKAGQPLFRLDSRDFQVGASQAQAQLAQAELQVRGLRAAYAREQATLQAAQSTVAYTARESARQKALVAAGISSQSQAAEAAHAAQQAADNLQAARQEAALALANLNGDPNLPLDRHPSVLAARALLDRATLNQSYTVVIAPVDGVVTRVNQLQPGAYVKDAQTVFWLISGKPWVEANFKENQLARMKVGQPVEIKVDAYKDAKLAGHVASFSPGTGQVFSALPAQNATGNWVKVTQRLPVRIEFDSPPPPQAGRGGLSAQVKVDVRSDGRAPPAAPAR
ncbi:MAG TPA: HlyD family secretion protein [Phenylobacterium sp.]|nr:HlyD family secretion protein [Phenylobacterium sp.]